MLLRLKGEPYVVVILRQPLCPAKDAAEGDLSAASRLVAYLEETYPDLKEV